MTKLRIAIFAFAYALICAYAIYSVVMDECDCEGDGVECSELE